MTIDQFGFVDGENISPGTFTFFPSIAVNADGGIALGYSASSPTINPGSYYTYRSPTDSTNSIRNSRTLRGGTDFYYRTFGGGANRWGDYSAIAVDPNDECFWVYNKHAVTRGVPTAGNDEDGVYETAFGEVCNATPIGSDDTATVDSGMTVTTVNGASTSVLDNDTDADSDDTLSAIILTPPTQSSAFTLNANGSFSYTHNNNSATTDSFTYNSCDDGTPVKCNQATVTITINQSNANTAPTLAAIGNQSVDELTLLSFTATATDADLPAQILSFSLTGSVPTGAAITTGGDFTWTPTEAQGAGTYTFNVVVTDNGAGTLTDSESITVTVNEVNVAPVLAGIGNQSVDELTLLSFTATATDADLPAQTLSFSLTGSVPTGAAITTGGAFTWTPTEAQGAGSYTFNVVVTDNGAGTLSDSESITITVNEVNVAPTADNDNYNATEDTVLTIIAPGVLIGDVDADGNSLSAILDSQPANGTVTLNNDGSFSYTPDANYCNDGSNPDTFTYHANDGLEDSNIATVSIAVSCVADTYTVSVDVNNLLGTGFELQLNAAETLSVTSNGISSFLTVLNENDAYSVTVISYPTDQFCTISNNSGTSIVDVTLTVSCRPDALFSDSFED